MTDYAVADPAERAFDLMDLEDRITELAAHIHAATYRLLELIREYDERGGWVGPGVRSCAHWLNWKCGIHIGAAREKVRVAHALKELPKISASFREGAISNSKVRAMTRVATPDNEDHLLYIARHGGCRFPGCTATRHVDAHHIRHWADGGETSLDNLVLLCRHHHRLVHEGSCGVKMGPDRAVEFTAPDGNPIPQVPEANFRGNVSALITENHCAGLQIDPNTPIPYWYGEKMDEQMAVEGMLEFDTVPDRGI